MCSSIFFLIIALAVAALILSKRIKDGIVIKAGLILVSLGFFGASNVVLDTPHDLLPAMHLIGVGAIVCMLGILIRGLITGGKCRRVADWIEQHSVTK